MKLQSELFLKWDDFTQELERQFNRKYNGSGIWNCPDAPAFNLDLPALKENSNYMHGDHKLICGICLDPLCEPGTWKDAIIPNDPEEFLAKFGKSGYNEKHPTSRQLVILSINAGLEFLVHRGLLPRGEYVWLYWEW